MSELPIHSPALVPGHESVRCLAADEFSQLWLVRHASSGCNRLVQLSPAAHSARLEELVRFTARVPRHPNVLPVLQAGAVGAWLHRLMPLAENALPDADAVKPDNYEPLSLTTLLGQRGGHLPAEEVISIGQEIIAGMAHLHNEGVSHGNLNLGNVLRFEGRWCLSGFGLRAPSQLNDRDHQPIQFDVTPDVRDADRIAIGLLLFELSTGLPPPRSQDLAAFEQPASPADPVAPHLLRVIYRATDGHVRARFASLDDFSAALGYALKDGKVGLHAQRSPGRWLVRAAIALGMALIVALLRYCARTEGSGL